MEVTGVSILERLVGRDTFFSPLRAFFFVQINPFKLDKKLLPIFGIFRNEAPHAEL